MDSGALYLASRGAETPEEIETVLADLLAPHVLEVARFSYREHGEALRLELRRPSFSGPGPFSQAISRQVHQTGKVQILRCIFKDAATSRKEIDLPPKDFFTKSAYEVGYNFEGEVYCPKCAFPEEDDYLALDNWEVRAKVHEIWCTDEYDGPKFCEACGSPMEHRLTEDGLSYVLKTLEDNLLYVRVTLEDYLRTRRFRRPTRWQYGYRPVDPSEKFLDSVSALLRSHAESFEAYEALRAPEREPDDIDDEIDDEIDS